MEEGWAEVKKQASSPHSNNYAEIPYEELEICVEIIVVDAFIRCKIFENPEGYRIKEFPIILSKV